MCTCALRAALEDTHATTEQLSQLLAELAPHITHKPALAPLATALAEFLHSLPEARGEQLMQHEEEMLRAIQRAQHETEHADTLLDEEQEEEVSGPPDVSTPRGAGGGG